MTRSPLRRAPPVPVPDAPPLRPPVSHWPRGDERIAVWASAISLTSRPHTARTSARTHRRPNPDGSTRRPPIIDATAPPALPVRALARPPIRRYRCRCRCRRVSSDHRHSSCHGGLRATAAIGTVLYLSIMLLGQHTTSAGCRAGNATIIEHRPAFRSNHVVCNAHFLRTPSRQLAATTRPPCRCMNAIRHLGATLPLHRPPPFAHSYYHRPRPRRMVVIGFGVPRRLRVALLSARPPARRRAACALGAAASGVLPSAPGLPGRQPTQACRRRGFIYCEPVHALAEQDRLPFAPIPIPTPLRLLRATRAEPLAGLLQALEPA